MMRLNHPVAYRRAKRRGSVLIVVMWIATGLVSVALLFGHSMMLENRAAENALAGAQAEQAVEGAIRYIQYALNNAGAGKIPDLENETNRINQTQKWIQINDGWFWLIGRSEQRSFDSPAFGLIDESSKLNLNTATVEMLNELPNMTEELAASIIDWRDEDAEATDNGAESPSYALRNPSHPSKNLPFETLFELHWVKGAKWQHLYGEDQNLNGFLDRNEQDGSESPPLDNGDRHLEPGLLDNLTVYSRHAATQRDGSDKIVIGQLDAEAFETLLNDTFASERAAEILRQAAGLASANVLQFFTRSTMTESEFNQIEAALTASEEEQQGLININTASAAVLRSVPGITETLADELVHYRQTHPDHPQTVAWAAEVLDDNAAAQAGPQLTGVTYQVTADIVAVGRSGKGYHRVRVVFDTSEGDAQVRYRRDLTRLGWALGEAVRQDLITNEERYRVQAPNDRL